MIPIGCVVYIICNDSSSAESFPPVMLIGAPQDLVVVRVRDVDDRIAWVLKRGDSLTAVELALQNRHLLRRHLVRTTTPITRSKSCMLVLLIQ